MFVNTLQYFSKLLRGDSMQIYNTEIVFFVVIGQICVAWRLLFFFSNLDNDIKFIYL